MYLTPREFDKLLIYMLAEVAHRRREQGLKLNHPEAEAGDQGRADQLGADGRPDPNSSATTVAVS